MQVGRAHCVIRHLKLSDNCIVTKSQVTEMTELVQVYLTEISDICPVSTSLVRVSHDAHCNGA